MPSPDLADTGQLPGDFVQQGRVGISEVEHGCVQSANTKDSGVWITKQPDHEILITRSLLQSLASGRAQQERLLRLRATLALRRGERAGVGNKHVCIPKFISTRYLTVGTKTVLPLRGVVSIS